MNRRTFVAALGGALLASVSGGAQAASSAAYARKMAAFDRAHTMDRWLGAQERALLDSVVKRLARVQSTVGHGNFHVLPFDGMLAVARGHASVEPFSRAEIEFIERLFHTDARQYGFLGEKVDRRLTEGVGGELRRVSGSSQKLLAGPALERYRAMKAAIGDDLVLTSGVRGIVKQTHLFLRKALRADGNLSRASRSLAPPGYSFHGVGDFDVGQRGLGAANFTDKFADTEVYRRLVDLGYLVERYPRGNRLGVRFEPWHVMVVGRDARRAVAS